VEVEVFDIGKSRLRNCRSRLPYTIQKTLGISDDELFFRHQLNNARSHSIEGIQLSKLLLRTKLIVSRNPRVHPCAPFVLTGWVKLENLHMFKDDISNPPAL
jgi:hypothetical protein